MPLAFTAEPVQREKLYDEVWSEPVRQIAGRYGISDAGLAKICRQFAVLRPSRGSPRRDHIPGGELAHG